MNHLQTIDTSMAEGRAALAAAYQVASAEGDRTEMARLRGLAVEIDRIRASLALDGLASSGAPFAQPSQPKTKVEPSSEIVVDVPAAPSPANAPSPPTRPAATEAPLAWAGVTDRRHGRAFRDKVVAIAARIGSDPSHLMAVMAFETGETFSPSILNAAGSGATGLIQFMPKTARGLGTTTQALAAMSAVDQLDYVERYFAQFGRRSLPKLSDVYMTVLWPAAVGRPESHILFRTGTRAYAQNRGLDRNGDGTITKAEATARVAAMLERGLQPGRVG